MSVRLSERATQEDRVCVLNILGGESRQVTPTSHAFSRGMLYSGLRPEELQRPEAPYREIPVYNNVLEGLKAGHEFTGGVVYLPPSGVRDG